MKNSFKPLFIIFIVAVLFSVVIEMPTGGKGLIPWRTDLTAALAEANVGHKMLLVEFSAGWCGPCQEMAKTTWSDKSVATELRNMVPVQIDVDSHPDIAREYGVQPIPAYIVLDSDGHAIKTGEGYRSPEEFIEWLHAKGKGP